MTHHVIRIVGIVAVSSLTIACQPREATTPRHPTAERMLRLEELTYPGIESLDRERTIFFVTFGNLEQHGPHLPVGSDYFAAIALRDAIIARLQQSHPDYTVVLVPVIPLGEGDFSDLARQFDHIGTLGIRSETLRDVAVDVGSAIARHGFQHIFLVHSHGAPLHNVAFTQAATFVSERFNVRMVNITSLIFGTGFFPPEVLSKHLGEDWTRLGLLVHAGPAETSLNLFLRPDLVDPDYRSLPPFPIMDFDELGQLHTRSGFRGYASDPSLASQAFGQDIMTDFADRGARIAERALAGEDLSTLPVWPEILPPSPELEETMRLVRERYARTSSELQLWERTQRSPQP